MKYLKSKASTVGIFFAAAILLVLYSLSIRWHIYLPVTFFWGVIILMIGTVVYQCLRIELSNAFAKVVLLEVAVACLVFHLIYQIPYYGLYGSDSYLDLAAARGVLSSGFVLGAPQYINPCSYFPMIHVFGVALSLITSIDLFSVAKWLPSFIDVTLIFMLYLLVRSIFKKEKLALLSVLLFASLEHHILFSSLFVRETFSLILGVGCIYLYFSAENSSHRVARYGLSIMCLIGTIFAHHLTSFMLLTFLSTHFIVTEASKFSIVRRAYFGGGIAGRRITTSYLSIAFVVLFAYWMYVVLAPLYTLVTFARSILSPAQWWTHTYAEISGVSTIITIRGSIMFYGFFFFQIALGLILLYGLLPRAKNRQAEVYSSTLFVFLCGLIGALSLYLVRAPAFPDRYLMFGWLFGFAALTATIMNFKSKWIRTAAVFLLIAFMLFNIYMIEPTAWDAGVQTIPSAPSEEDYVLARTLNFSVGNIIGYGNPIMAIYDVHNNFGEFLPLYGKVNVTQFDWLIIQKKEVELEKTYYHFTDTATIDALEQLATEYSFDYDIIYESNNLVVFKLIQ
ncbi:MAG TPA: hypothetical protein VIH48_04780 [Candidatus Bathyarchaeia archaeon]